ncbi:MerR family transcriptional regulator [Chondromyces apiculatus]|uniref:Transcriptional regulator, MerR family n=1 Tax=Chondromyces apiculatus DSM 436 TaxID=1192034 RepID=A0A017T1Z7_9BACT|nr:MerR family transcriptional regulator [Chondromyces apiculatus]EYF03263.1 Transcriptional regulator, MerR family [Chondromyces apiculatus DSM 436]
MTMAQRHHLPLAQDSGTAVTPPDVRTDLSGGPGEGGGDDERLFQVGDLAKATGKTVRAIHHYEELGLLTPHARSKGRYRLYDEGALTRVRWIGKLCDLGLSLGQIQQIVSHWKSSSSAPEGMAHVRTVYQQKLEETRAQIAHLSALERELEASLAYLDTCETCDPGRIVVSCSRCNHHDAADAQPDLVAGIHGGNGRRPLISPR